MRTQALQLVLFALFVLGTAAGAQERTLRISFDDLDSLVAGNSPLAQTRSLELDRVHASREADLRWSNPELEYEHERVDAEREQVVALGKSFELPWKTSRRRAEWKYRIEAADWRREQTHRQQLAEIRGGYVALSLYQRQLAILDQLDTTLDDVARIAAVRHEEGRISGIESRQIQLAAISVTGTRLELLAEYRQRRADWLTALGMNPADSLSLATAVTFAPRQLPGRDELVAAAASTPGLRVLEAEQLALAAHVDVQRSWLLPEVALSGGYKTVDPDLGGFVAGISLQLPLFSQNQASIRGAEIERSLVATEAERERSRMSARIDALLTSIQETQRMLEEFTSISGANPDALEDLLVAYADGWLSLPDLLNAVQLEAGSLAGHTTLVLTWYESLFALEALTGIDLARLPQE
ncbi:TolC family protein [bacterium]|nr:TolC family protein [bacterium]